MENVIKKNDELYQELIKVKKDQAAVALDQSEQARGLEMVGNSLKELREQLDTKAQRLAVYENIEACEKANKAEAERLSVESDRITAENQALADARVKLQKEIKDKLAQVNSAKESYEAELAAVKKTQAELKEKQAKVDKFLAQVK